MVQKNERNGCSSCLLKLSLMQAQIENVEKMLYCIKDTLNFKEACLYTGLSNSQLYKTGKEREHPSLQTKRKTAVFQQTGTGRMVMPKPGRRSP